MGQRDTRWLAVLVMPHTTTRAVLASARNAMVMDLQVQAMPAGALPQREADERYEAFMLRVRAIRAIEADMGRIDQPFGLPPDETRRCCHLWFPVTFIYN